MGNRQKKLVALAAVPVLIALVLLLLFMKPAIVGLASVQLVRLYAIGGETKLVESYYPLEDYMEITKPNNQIFHIVPKIPENGYIDVIWYKNGSTVSNNYNYTFFGTDPLGDYNLTAAVSDGVEREAIAWQVHLREKQFEDECIGNCCGVVCPDTVRTCDDGYIVGCSNRCDIFTGACGSCASACVNFADKISYTAAIDEPAPLSKRTMPCYNVTYVSKQVLDLSEAELSRWIKIPRGYDTVLEPFSLECSDEKIDFTFSISSRYRDVQVLKCTGGECFPSLLTTTTSLSCGGRLVEELKKEKRYVDPKTIPIDIEPVALDLKSFKESLQSGKSEVRFYGDVFEKLRVTLSRPEEPVPEAVNPSLKIVGSPVELIIGSLASPVSTQVTLPYVADKAVGEDSLALYVHSFQDNWVYVGGEIDAINKTVTANVTDISQYLDEDNKTIIAVMGIIICGNCTNATLDMIFMSSPPSRDAVVLVHGLASSPATYKEIIDDITITNQPFQVWTFSYPSEHEIEDNAIALANLLEAHKSSYDNIYIIGHSSGGLVVQQALFHASLENKKDPQAYSFLPKVKKVILAGAPNEGSPATELYQNLFQYYVNYKTEQGIFSPKSPVVQQLVEGLITPRVPGINYYVLAGTKPLQFNLLFFKATTDELLEFFEKNDGLIDVKSAQRIGDAYVSNQCENYWEINVTHTDLIDNEVSRQIIERLIAEELLSNTQQVALLGNNKYFEFSIDDCSPEDRYIVIGKPIPEEEALDVSGCSCGNGYCGIGENVYNCPSDCLRLLSKENIFKLRSLFFLLLLIPISIGILHYRYAMIRRKEELQRIRSFMRYHYDVSIEGGNKLQDIEHHLLSEGFSRRSVMEYYRALHRTLSAHHQKLKAHIEHHHRMGHPVELLKQRLIEHGWHPSMVHAAAHNDSIQPLFRKKIKHIAERKYFFVKKTQ